MGVMILKITVGILLSSVSKIYIARKSKDQDLQIRATKIQTNAKVTSMNEKTILEYNVSNT